jgi:predicted RNA-binding protein with TRAM domain
MGESKPGDVGDSKGTFHDRATSDNNVIVDGKAQSYEDYKQDQTVESSTGSETDQGQNETGSEDQTTSRSTDQYSELDGEVVEVTVERVSGSGNPIATHRGFHVHVPEGEPGKSYEVKLDAESGYFVGKLRSRE